MNNLLKSKNTIYLITKRKNQNNLIKRKKIKTKQIIETKNFKTLINKIRGKKIIIDIKTCSYFYENIFSIKFKILKKDDPIYFLKSIKNNSEIQNMIQSHILDGVALTKFLFWIQVLIQFQALVQMELLFIIEQKKKNQKLLKKLISFYATLEGNINMVRLMSQELYVFQNREII